MIVRHDGECEVSRDEIDLTAAPSADRLDHLTGFEIDVLICGGISMPLIALIESRGIKVVPCIAGDVEAVILAFLERRIPGDEFLIPGCGKKRLEIIPPDSQT